MGIERKDIRFGATHALERTGCTAMQSGVSSANSCALQYHRQCVEHLLLRDGVRDSCLQAQGWFIDKQQHRQASSFQALNLPADDLGDMKCDGCKKGRIGQEGPALMKQIRRQGDWALNLPLNGDRRAEDPG